MQAKPAPFIPPLPLLFAQAMLLVSWGALFAAEASPAGALSPVRLVWIHAAALGWITTTALAFMTHVVPAVTDVTWRFPRLARRSILVHMAGVVVLLLGFSFWQPAVIAAGGAVVTIGIAAYAVAFFATVATALRDGDAAARAIARAFCLVVSALLAAVVLGFIMAAALTGGRPALLQLAPIHGALGVVGWIALLVAGVSARTFNRLIGRSDRRRAHVTISSTAFAGLIVWIAGSATHVRAVAVCGGVLLAVSALLYAVTTLRALRSPSARPRLPREFIFASMVWLIVASLLGVTTIAGYDLSSAMLFLLLVGWVGQTLNAHLMHTGIRLLATIAIGDEDETEPIELLDRRWGLASLAINQIAVLCGALGLSIGSAPLLRIAAVAGIGAMLAMAANVLHALEVARSLRTVHIHRVSH